MKRTPAIRLIVFVMLIIIAPAVYSQTPEASRDKTKDRLNLLLQRVGPTVKIDFRQNAQTPYLFSGSLRDGLTNSESMEVVITVTRNETISIKVFPHYKGGYINIDKARNTTQLLRQLVQFNETAFLFWGADDTGDVFTGYTFTLESGFPDEAIKVVLSSIKNSDDFVGKLRPSIDGTNAP